ncbi:MAG: DUF6261 family protein [Tannerella sp.]|nr:DUF6261 family protein [Tannerella sp.]
MYGDLTHTDYDSETAGLDSVITRLFSPAYHPSVTVLNLEMWILELQRLNGLFKNYVKDTAKEHINRLDITARNRPHSVTGYRSCHRTDQSQRAG